MRSRNGINLNIGENEMLLLTRKLNESVMIGDDTKVTILGIKGNNVKLGFSCPDGIKIYRTELYAKIQSEGIDNLKELENE